MLCLIFLKNLWQKAIISNNFFSKLKLFTILKPLATVIFERKIFCVTYY